MRVADARCRACPSETGRFEGEMIMTSLTRNIIAFAFVLGSTIPTVAQSANRTSSGVQALPQAAAVTTPELASTTKCREHCGALSASAPHQPHRTVAENRATASACVREMA